MPRGDRRGPEGMGPMTGRARGYCAGYSEPGFVDNGGYGRGSGLGRGRGRGFFGRARGFFGRGPVYNQPVYGAPENEAEYLKAEAEDIKSRLEAISSRLKDLEKNTEEK